MPRRTRLGGILRQTFGLEPLPLKLLATPAQALREPCAVDIF